MTLLAWIIALPLAGTLALSFFPRMPDRAAATIGAGSTGISALIALWVLASFLTGDAASFQQTLWTWVSTADFTSNISLYLDGLSATMVGVVCGVGFLIHLFATWYMKHDLQGEFGMGRFFAYMNLFMVSMLILVLGNNLLLLFLGWEGVGLCSYLLIGFHYRSQDNAWAGYKAFIMSRTGDVSFAIGLFLLFHVFGTLNIQTILHQAPEVWSRGDLTANLAALLLLGGAVGKSAQLPLQTWLPDAMAGPTPVSALIHAATMVTAGVYLIARTHVIFQYAPDVLLLVGIVGAITLLLAGFAALAQTDIKRVIAYSTMSQIGYMFLALGVGAWHAAIFHLMVHAFFKSLLFLASGSVIIACHHEQDMLRMGGLRHKLKLDYIVFLIGGASLSALPIVTAGFYSKDRILSESFMHGYHILWAAALVGAFLTAVYTFRMIFLTFHGEAHTEAHPGRGITHHLPLIVLALLSTFLGAFIHPPLAGVLPGGETAGDGNLELILQVISGAVAVVGIGAAAGMFLGKRRFITAAVNQPMGRALWQTWHHAWGFDWLYDQLLVRPFAFTAYLNRHDPFNWLLNRVAVLAIFLNGAFVRVENGRLRWYAATFFAGATLVFAALLFG